MRDKVLKGIKNTLLNMSKDEINDFSAFIVELDKIHMYLLTSDDGVTALSTIVAEHQDTVLDFIVSLSMELRLIDVCEDDIAEVAKHITMIDDSFVIDDSLRDSISSSQDYGTEDDVFNLLIILKLLANPTARYLNKLKEENEN